MNYGAIAWTVPGPPVGAARPRVVKGGQHTYMPDRHTAWEAACIYRAQQAFPGMFHPHFTAAVAVEIVAWQSRPKRLRRRADPRETIASTSKPDADNIAKLVMDAATKAGVWRDDTAVADLRVRRRYLPIDATGQDVGLERVEVTVYALDDSGERAGLRELRP